MLVAWSVPVVVRRKMHVGEKEKKAGEILLHALGAAGPVTVVEIEPLALVDEGADAVLP